MLQENKLQAIQAAKRVTESSHSTVGPQRGTQRPLAVQQQQLEVAIPSARAASHYNTSQLNVDVASGSVACRPQKLRFSQR